MSLPYQQWVRIASNGNGNSDMARVEEDVYQYAILRKSAEVTSFYARYQMTHSVTDIGL